MKKNIKVNLLILKIKFILKKKKDNEKYFIDNKK
jgi:hypothetical protein